MQPAALHRGLRVVQGGAVQVENAIVTRGLQAPGFNP
jgi:hypothetical protein